VPCGIGDLFTFTPEHLAGGGYSKDPYPLMRYFGKASAHGIKGGLFSFVQGGKFEQGFFSAAVSDLTGGINVGSSMGAQVALGAVVGGTVEEIGGGKFANGAVTGSFTVLFNQVLHKITDQRESLALSAEKEWRIKSAQWATNGGDSKCNIFAQDKMEENNMAPYDCALAAGKWGDEKEVIPGWEIVKDGLPQRGDIAAYKYQYSHATGHMGIVVSYSPATIGEARIIYAGSGNYDYIVKTALQDFGNDKAWVIRRYVGK
jgi:hypothetical protein